MLKHRKYLALSLILVMLLIPLVPAQAAPIQGIIYEVFVRAFADSDGDGIGDLKGLTAKLDYVESLGAKAIWLLPVFPSPTYHGYDVLDYRDINPDYGTLADFDALLQAAHQRGIKILLDIPFNHTSSQHPWFISSKDPGSPYRDWYWWRSADDKDTNFEQVVWDNKPWKRVGDSYYYALFWDGMPDLNHDNPAVVAEVIDTAKFWLSRGVDGFRLDAASHIYAEGERGMKQEIDRSAAFWRHFRESIQAEYPDAYLLGEVWEALEPRANILTGLDAVVNFDVGEKLIPIIKQGGSGAAFVAQLQKIYAAYEEKAPGRQDAPFLSNHDQNRVFASLTYKADKAALAARVLLTLPGNPIIYYGEEIGMAGAKPDEELRTPMLWGGDDPLTTSWHPSKYNKRTVPVVDQVDDPESLLSIYRQYAALRIKHPALREGTFAPYESDNPIPIAFYREVPRQKLLALHNPSANPQTIALPGGAAFLSDGKPAGKSVELPPYGSLILAVSGGAR